MGQVVFRWETNSFFWSFFSKSIRFARMQVSCLRLLNCLLAAGRVSRIPVMTKWPTFVNVCAFLFCLVSFSRTTYVENKLTFWVKTESKAVAVVLEIPSATTTTTMAPQTTTTTAAPVSTTPMSASTMSEPTHHHDHADHADHDHPTTTVSSCFFFLLLFIAQFIEMIKCTVYFKKKKNRKLKKCFVVWQVSPSKSAASQSSSFWIGLIALSMLSSLLR